MERITVFHLGQKHRSFLASVVSKLEHGWSFHHVSFDSFEQHNLPGHSILVIDEDVSGSKRDIFTFVRQKKDNAALLFILPSGIEPDDPYDESVDFLELPLTGWRVGKSLLQLAKYASTKAQVDLLNKKLSLQNEELSELNKIGIALSAERDQVTLLTMILTKAREITSADAGSLYLVEKIPGIPADENNFWHDKQLRFKLAQNDSLQANYVEFVLPVQKKSMAGFAALTGEPLNIADAYQLSPESEVQHNRSFDEKMGYHTVSVLCIPMKNHRHEIIGVLQLINRKKDKAKKLNFGANINGDIIPFDDRCVDLASSLAGQAAVSIENMNLYEEIKQLFEGFIVASVHAIEQRDPTTSGHSERVATLTVSLAKVIDQIAEGPYKNVHFTRDDIQQINYASLLHDFGKIGVRENVLVKAKKLYPEQLEAIKLRFKYMQKAYEALYSERKLDYLLRHQGNGTGKVQKFDMELQQKIIQLKDYLDFIMKANEPRVLEEGGYDKLLEIGEFSFQENGTIEQYLTTEEIEMLSIARGSLSEIERHDIESHVVHTFNFLRKIPWASHLRDIPQIAYAHHEKLDGSGYPRKLNSTLIPLPSKIMTISDIYDALTAWDRPYKKAVPREKALDILSQEARSGKIDSYLFNIFLESKIYELVKRPDEAL